MMIKIYNYLLKNLKKFDLVIVNDFGHNFLTSKTINIFKKIQNFYQ